MTKIVRQLLQFARRKGAEKTPCDSRGLVEEAIALLRPLAHKHAVELIILPTSVDPIVPVDASQFQQVVTNLVMNAVQAMPRGGRVELSLEVVHTRPPAEPSTGDADYLCLAVKDSGAGIEPGNLGQIFEPFFTTKDVGEGTGLGLPVSYGIVRDHGGWIDVTSKIGQGSTFCVFLPRVVAP